MQINHTLFCILAGFIYCNVCSAKIGHYEITVKFINDFFEEQHGISYNIFGCWSKKERHAYLKKDVQDNVKESNFGTDLNNIKKIELFWLVADSQACNITEYLHEVNQENMFLPPYKHLILVSAHDFYYYIELMETYDILSTSKVVIARINDTEATLSMVYKIRRQGHLNANILRDYLYRHMLRIPLCCGRDQRIRYIEKKEDSPKLKQFMMVQGNGKLLSEQYGAWSYQNGLYKTPQKKSFLERRKNFQKYPLNLGLVIFEDEEVLKSNFDDISRTPEFVFQQDMPLLYSLAQSVNATMKIFVYNNHGSGKFNKSTGEISGYGMVIDLYKGKIDISASFLWTPERNAIVQPIAPTRMWGLQFFLKKPSLSYVKNIYVLTLSKWVWIATFLLTVIFLAALYVALNWEIRSNMEFQKNEQTASLRKVNTSDMLLLSFEALCQQGTVLEPLKITGRILLLFLFLMFMFVYVAYSANILVLLGSTAKLNTLSDLLESRFEVGGQDQPHVKFYFERPKKGILRELYLKKIHPGNYYDEAKGLEKVKEGNFAFMAPIVDSYRYFLKNFTNYDICSLQELPGFMDMTCYPAAPKTSGHAEILKVWLLNLIERGMVERTRVRVARKPRCNNQGGSFEPVRILDCIYVIMIFFYGLLISLLTLFIEVLVKKYVDWKNLQYTESIHSEIE